MAQTLQIDDTQVRLLPPNDTARLLETCVIANPNEDLVYLNLWDDTEITGSPARPIGSVMDQIPLAAGASITVFLSRLCSGSFVLNATTSRDGTGAPSIDIEIGGLRWLA